MENVSIVGPDIAEQVFQVHGINAAPCQTEPSIRATGPCPATESSDRG